MAVLIMEATEARIVREALDAFMKEHPLTSVQEDICWDLIAKISRALRTDTVMNLGGQERKK